MLNSPTKEALIALDQVSKFPRWSDINKMFDAELTAVLDALVATRDEATLHELRGRAKVIRDLQKLVRDAPATLRKMGVTSPL